MAAREPRETPTTGGGGSGGDAAGRAKDTAGRGSEPTDRGSDAGRTGTTAGRTGTAGGQGTGRGSQGSRLGWIAIAVAGVLTAWQVVYALTAPTSPNPENYASVSLLLTLVLSVGAIVLGVVALGQRAQPRWPATAATAVGTFAFIVCVATWIGTLMV